MKIRKSYISILLLILVVALGVVIVYYNSQNNTFNNNDKTSEIPNMFSMMLETEAGSGEYKQSNASKWPGSGYEFNDELSYCKNGSKLVWDENKHAISVKTSKLDMCYVYFDIVSSDLILNIKNKPVTITERKNGSINCTGSNTTYNQQYDRIEFSSFNNNYSTCTLDYSDSPSKVNLASYIIGLSGTTQGTGQVVNENGYRYEGKNPNNYIWFNNEYWRIIGVFDSSSHGQSGKNLVKIIRNDILGGLVWDKTNTNNWVTSSLKTLLNESYYNAEDGTNSGYCYGAGSYLLTANCNYTKKGIQPGYRDMIVNVTWYLGGYSDISATVESFYGYERGTTVYSGNPTSTTGYIGLIYPSDYGYGALSNDCARTTNLSLYGEGSSYGACANKNWLYGNDRTLTASSASSSKLFTLNYTGHLLFGESNNGSDVRPVLYLDSSVYKINGDGSLKNPYIIGM